MKRTLYLHLGVHRTATTSIQKYLFQNFSNLMEKGYFYPFQVPRHLHLVNKLFAGTRTPGDIAQNLERLISQKPHDIHSVILSDEDICIRKNLSILARFKDHFDVKPVFTLRRQDIWLESWFFQNIKWQWNRKLSHCTFDEFLSQREDFHWIHYDRYLRHIEDLFGQENVIVRIHEKDQMPGGPVTSFCDAIGLTDREGFVDPPHVNSSLSSEISEFIRHLPLDLAKPKVRLVLTESCAVIDREIIGNTKRQSERLLPHKQRREILAEYASGNRAVAQRYFGRDELFLEPLPDADAPLAKLELPQDSAMLMKRFVAPLLAELIRRDAIGPANTREEKK